jgi:hypothetical protein
MGLNQPKGYMVASPVKQAPVVDADDFFNPAKGRKILGDFVKANKKDLGGGKKYLGLWHNKEDNKVYLDVSENVQDKSTATRLGRERNQISIWDVVNFEEIGTGGTGVTEKRRDSDGGITIRYIGDDRRTNRFLGGFDLQQTNEVEKHSTHDQSSHAGSRRRIGSDATETQPRKPQGEQEVTDPDAPKPKLKPGRKPDASGSLEERAEKLANGERVQVSKKEAKKMMKIMAKREDNPDLTNMHIEDTQLYDEDNLGIPRNKMPQVPSDTKAVFISEMEKRGVRVQRGVADPAKLHPIQEEMSASKVGLIMKKLRKKGMKTDDGGRIVISKDNFVIDGHHRWAAAAMLSFEDSSIKLPVIRVDMNHKDLIDVTLAWNKASGIQSIGMGESNPGSQFRKWAEFDYIIAKAIRGRTIVRFQPGLKPVVKHQQHDQQSHGNWAVEGGSVASSKAKQFFDNGGTISNKLDRLGEPSPELTSAQAQMKEMSDKLGFEWSIDSGVLQTAEALGVIKYGDWNMGGDSIFVARGKDGSLAGAISFRTEVSSTSPDKPTETVLEIEHLGSTGLVDGTGSALAKKVIKVAAEKNRKIVLRALDDNAQAFWTKVGFQTKKINNVSSRDMEMLLDKVMEEASR